MNVAGDTNIRQLAGACHLLFTPCRGRAATDPLSNWLARRLDRDRDNSITMVMSAAMLIIASALVFTQGYRGASPISAYQPELLLSLQRMEGIAMGQALALAMAIIVSWFIGSGAVAPVMNMFRETDTHEQLRVAPHSSRELLQSIVESSPPALELWPVCVGMGSGLGAAMVSLYTPWRDPPLTWLAGHIFIIPIVAWALTQTIVRLAMIQTVSVGIMSQQRAIVERMTGWTNALGVCAGFPIVPFACAALESARMGNAVGPVLWEMRFGASGVLQLQLAWLIWAALLTVQIAMVVSSSFWMLQRLERFWMSAESTARSE